MQVTSLDDDELLTLVVLAKYMVHVDGNVSRTEMLDLVSLGEAVGMERFEWALRETEGLHEDPHAVLDRVNAVTRWDAKVLIFLLLEELAKGDDFVVRSEEDTLAELRERWGL
ncbi:MAG: hypothetical protein H6737_28815 [Alphaproteobacteria bacterium]|nr:hypothetical protein [Alphaproteobacteria bacterium]